MHFYENFLMIINEENCLKGVKKKKKTRYVLKTVDLFKEETAGTDFGFLNL